MTFMLQELNLVDAHELENIMAMFHAVDANDDGKLNLADVRRQLLEDVEEGEASKAASGGTSADARCLTRA
jgi:hypothetical protein